MPASSKLPPIATLTLNPALDVTYEIEQLVKNQKAHAKATRYDPGGNGINVGRALKRLGVFASNFCVLAGETGQLMERLLTRHLDEPVYLQVQGETRINSTILEQRTATQYEISGIGPPLPQNPLTSFAASFIDRVGQGYGVVTGSVPPQVPEYIYGSLVRAIRNRDGLPVLDAHKALLRHGLVAKPFLVKPNRYELEQLTGKPLPRLDDVVTEAARLHASGIDYVCVSLGPEGAVLIGEQGAYHGLPPEVPLRSSVGAGDSMVAGLVAAFARGASPAEALRLAVACGAGTVQQPGTELFFPDQLQDLIDQVELRIL